VTAANGGQPVTLHARAEVADEPAPVPIGDSATWALLTDMLADAPARARAFGVNSLLRLPFASAVKTGTSSDFRDTWTIGYTRDYTVALWVGNFDGSPMRRVSGVTGAAPLWNRIMLHLYESHEPAPFAHPSGYVLAPMCATTGRTPDRACAESVTEFVDSGDRAVLSRPAEHLGSEYDTWLSQQPKAVDGVLRIVAPREGDDFVASPDSSIIVDVRGASDDLIWRINGVRIAHHETRFLYPLERGQWTIAATSRGHTSRVHIRVGNALKNRSVQGFTSH
jgi:penicillin-binding protein 1C